MQTNGMVMMIFILVGKCDFQRKKIKSEKKAVEDIVCPLGKEELKGISPVFEEDLYEAVSLKNCVDKRETLGAPGEKAMEQEIAASREWMETHPAI